MTDGSITDSPNVRHRRTTRPDSPFPEIFLGSSTSAFLSRTDDVPDPVTHRLNNSFAEFASWATGYQAVSNISQGQTAVGEDDDSRTETGTIIVRRYSASPSSWSFTDNLKEDEDDPFYDCPSALSQEIPDDPITEEEQEQDEESDQTTAIPCEEEWDLLRSFNFSFGSSNGSPSIPVTTERRRRRAPSPDYRSEYGGPAAVILRKSNPTDPTIDCWVCCKCLFDNRGEDWSCVKCEHSRCPVCFF